MAYIYKITNNINQKIYIGKTLGSIENRWKEHLKDYKKERCEKRPLYDAMNKYGLENFSIEQIEECSSEIVNNRETYWIEYYGSFKYGYNATKGGDGKSYADYDLIFSLWNEGKNEKEISQILSYDTKTIRQVLDEYKISSEEKQKRGRKIIQHCVAMLDKNSLEIIKVFPSLKEAYNFLGKQQSGHIASVCNEKRKTAYGYSWKYI